MLYSQIYGTIFVLGFSAFTIFYLKWGLLGLYLTTMFDELTRGIVNFLRFYFGVNPLRKLPELSKKDSQKAGYERRKERSRGSGIRG